MDVQIVLARMRDGSLQRVQGTLTTDWQLVQARWRFLDEALQRGRLYVEHVNTDSASWLWLELAPIRHLMVRTTDDPIVARAPMVTLYVVDGPGTKDRRAAEARYGRLHDMHGHVGGWIYLGATCKGESCNRRLSGQGWGAHVPKRAIGQTFTPDIGHPGRNIHRYHLLDVLSEGSR